MIYFLLPRNDVDTYTHLNIELMENPPTHYISTSLSYYLSDIKNKINNHEKEWDIYKKYTNPYEYIHTSIPNKKRAVSKHKPLSRSYFKMIEIVRTFKLTDFIVPMQRNIYPDEQMRMLKSPRTPIRTFHLAEGPGGFIEAIVELRQNPKDLYVGMTILDDIDDNVPAWKKSNHFLDNNKNVYIETGIDNTGNILNVANFVFCKEKYASSMDLITADGGFDFSVDFGKQEVSISRLLFAQIAYALCMQKKNGCFILKIFDSFMQHTVDLIHLLSSFYEKVYITKPLTSRFANSEKYVVCCNFMHSSCKLFYPYIKRCFDQMVVNPKLYIHRFLNINSSNYFLTKIEEHNSIFGQQQIENIYQTISLIDSRYKNEKINNLVKTNIQKSTNWCIKYDVPYNSGTIYPIS
jgi:23S rRNA U2552 (ribose-2'-O)-methylase RlmE/FtsJ